MAEPGGSTGGYRQERLRRCPLVTLGSRAEGSKPPSSVECDTMPCFRGFCSAVITVIKRDISASQGCFPS